MTDGGIPRFSLVGFAVAVVTVGAGTAAGLSFVPEVGSYLGMLLGGFVAGLAVEDRPLLEAGAAAVLATLGILAAGSMIGNGIGAAVSALGSIAPTALLTSTVLSFAVGAFGAHFGDDMRDGLTDPVETTPTGSTALRPAAAPTGEEKDEATDRQATDEATVARTGEDGTEAIDHDDRERELE